MSSFWSRIVVAVVGLPAVLGLVWLGGWWLCGLLVAAGLVALHEFYALARALRPLVLAGYAGLVLALLGAQLEGPPWMLGGFVVTLALAFLLKGVSDTRQSLTVAVAATVLGVAWIGLGLAYVLLLRGIPEHGRLAVLTGKTWEGLVASTVAAVLVPFLALYHQHFLSVGESLVLGAVIAVAAPVGDLFESAVKRDFGVKDSGRLLGGHGGVLDRLDAPLFAAVAAFYTILALT